MSDVKWYQPEMSELGGGGEVDGVSFFGCGTWPGDGARLNIRGLVQFSGGRTIVVPFSALESIVEAIHEIYPPPDRGEESV